MKELIQKYFCGFYLLIVTANAQIANYVNNGGFEVCSNCHTLNSPKMPKYWGATDSIKFSGELLSKSLNNVPLSSYTYQWPRHGDSFLGSSQYCTTCMFNWRGYPRNRLKKNLDNGKTYCFTMFVNLTNRSTYGIDAIGAYLADAITDTIKECNIALTYLNPQIKNPTNNIIIDTLKWTMIRGYYTANGSEKYVMIGNFNSDAGTDTIMANPFHLPARFANYLFDDVSLIDIDLPAFAGRDTSVIPGDSIFIGREPDVGIDEACIWYKAPDFVNAIDTVAGLWIKPTENISYVVRQEICGNVKWDTVTVHLNPVGWYEELKIVNEELKIYPVPAQNEVQLSVRNAELVKNFNAILIFNQLGEFIREEELKFNEGRARINTNELSPGVYFFQLKADKTGTVNKKFMISR